jgi:HD domain
MNANRRIAYRVHQFWLAILPSRTPVPDASLQPYLTPELLLLFHRMLPSEQRHSLLMLQRLLVHGYTDPELLAAALLHDVGKSLSPLSILDRILIVLGKSLLPRLASHWGTGSPHGLRRPFVVAACHPAWGADLALAAGASPRLCDLIQRHQDPSTEGDPLLSALQAADDNE